MDACERLIDQLPFYSLSRLSFIPWGGLVKNVSQLLCNEALWNFVDTSHIPHAYPTCWVHFDFLGISSMRSIYLKDGFCVFYSQTKRWPPPLQRETDGGNWQLLVESYIAT